MIGSERKDAALEIRQYAETVLFSTTLDDKLRPPPPLIDQRRGTPLPHPPKTPARPDHLLMDHEPCLPIPRAENLGEPIQRRVLLHAFANHELLAIETMALALLKFPDAPPHFRRGLIKTMSEEQKHFQLYRQRLEQLGGQFGEFPVNGFFWNTLAKMERPEHFLATMSLTFEQANLDYCLYYQDHFRRFADEETARILQIVLDDELGHVAFGLNWFQRLTDKEVDLWQRHAQHLLAPLNLKRAKGKIFSRELREKIGFDPEYIDELERFEHSTGRTSNVYIYFPQCEDNLSLAPKAYTPTKIMQAMTRDLDTLPLVFAKQDDIVLVRKFPRTDFLDRLKTAGFSLPQFIQIPEPPSPCPNLRNRKIHQLRPWGWCPSVKQLFSRMALKGVCPTTTENLELPVLKRLFSKSTSCAWLAELVDLHGPGNPLISPPEHCGSIVGSWEELEITGQSLFEKNYQKIVSKAPLSLAGQNFVFASSLTELIDQKPRLLNLLQRYGHLVVEPWLNKVFDYSLQLEILPNGEVLEKGFARFLTDQRGRYLGALIGGLFTGIPQDVVQILNQPQKTVTRQSLGHNRKKLNCFYQLNREVAQFVGQKLAPLKYVGAVGVDQFVYRDQNNQVRIKPIVELNPRYNMGRLVVELQKKIQPGRYGLWQVYSQHDLAAFSVSNFAEFFELIQTRFPVLRLNERQQIVEGALWLSDPLREAHFCGVLLVAEHYTQLHDPKLFHP